MNAASRRGLRCAVAALGLLLAPAADADPGPASVHVQRLLAEGQRLPAATEREAALERLLDRDFDLERIARTAIGAGYARMSEAQRGEYHALFREHVVLSVVRQVVLTPIQDAVIIEARDLAGQSSLIVTRVVDAQGRVRLASWRVDGDGGRQKIVDVTVDGVSLATTRADELRSVLQRSGGAVPALLVAMRAQNAQMRR